MPHKAAGWRTDPPVSVPSEMWHMCALMAAADPPEDPPAVNVGSMGFRVGP